MPRGRQVRNTWKEIIEKKFKGSRIRCGYIQGSIPSRRNHIRIAN